MDIKGDGIIRLDRYGYRLVGKDGKVKKEYEKMYGPLSLTSAAEGERYAWMQDPWPWEYAANCRKEG